MKPAFSLLPPNRRTPVPARARLGRRLARNNVPLLMLCTGSTGLGKMKEENSKKNSVLNSKKARFVNAYYCGNPENSILLMICSGCLRLLYGCSSACVAPEEGWVTAADLHAIRGSGDIVYASCCGTYLRIARHNVSHLGQIRSRFRNLAFFGQIDP